MFSVDFSKLKFLVVLLNERFMSIALVEKVLAKLKRSKSGGLFLWIICRGFGSIGVPELLNFRLNIWGIDIIKI